MTPAEQRRAAAYARHSRHRTTCNRCEKKPAPNSRSCEEHRTQRHFCTECASPGHNILRCPALGRA